MQNRRTGSQEVIAKITEVQVGAKLMWPEVLRNSPANIRQHKIRFLRQLWRNYGMALDGGEYLHQTNRQGTRLHQYSRAKHRLQLVIHNGVGLVLLRFHVGLDRSEHRLACNGFMHSVAWGDKILL